MTMTRGALGLLAVLTLPSSAFAAEFYAHPLNPGVPKDLPGETLVPGLPETLTVLDTATRPILQPILAPDVAGAPASAPEPALRHRHPRHGHHKAIAHVHRHGAHRAA